MEARVNGFEEELKQWFEQHSSEDRAFVYLYGDHMPATGKSWCPDCVDADPLIHKAAQEAGVDLFELPVGTREQYKNNPTHPARVNAKLKLTAIPTLIEFHKDGYTPGSRLVEDECKDPERLKNLFEPRH
jgi:thiol-disulfide isomerase/thioredoxin